MNHIMCGGERFVDGHFLAGDRVVSLQLKASAEEFDMMCVLIDREMYRREHGTIYKIIDGQTVIGMKEWPYEGYSGDGDG